MKILDYHFTNARDPYVLFHDGKYYTLISNDNKLWLKISDNLSDILNDEMHLVFTPSDEYCNCLWAPELHIIDDVPYIYVTMSEEFGKPQHMFVLTTESKKINDKYKVISYIKHKDDAWAIDGTILKHEGKLYYIYSAFGIYDDSSYQALYISEMENPYTLKGEVKLLSKSEYDWELKGCNGKDRPYVNEGAFALYRDNKIYVAYSASGCWTDYYCLGLLEFKGGNILLKDNWYKHKTPILDSSCGYVAPGHASFIQNDPSGVEYCAFHAYETNSNNGEKYVHSYIYPFVWKENKPVIVIK